MTDRIKELADISDAYGAFRLPIKDAEKPGFDLQNRLRSHELTEQDAGDALTVLAELLGRPTIHKEARTP